jgi:succinoglycan biosynthesis transport protein ExoP
MEIFDRPLSSANEYWRGPPPRQVDQNRKAGAFDTIDLLAVLGRLWVRRRLIITSGVVCGALSFGVAKLSTPSYVGTALVMIQPQQAIIGTSDAIARAQSTSEIINTETFVLRSRALARETIERLHLDRDPEFNPPPKPTRLRTLIAPVLPIFDSLANWAQNATVFFFDAASPPPITGEKIEPTSKLDTEVVNAVLQRLRVAPQEQSNVIEVSFASSNSQTAASVPNTLIEIYLERRRREAERKVVV